MFQIAFHHILNATDSDFEMKFLNINIKYESSNFSSNRRIQESKSSLKFLPRGTLTVVTS